MTENGAIISSCGSYRYLLWRSVENSNGEYGTLTFVMLNPSIADANVNDPTIRKCLGFARRWGFTRIEVVNLFALRATDPDNLLVHPSPIGHENDRHIAEALTKAKSVVFAWGGIDKKFYQRAKQVALFAFGRDLPANCLGYTKTGQPRHPLMLAYATPLMPFGGDYGSSALAEGTMVMRL